MPVKRTPTSEARPAAKRQEQLPAALIPRIRDLQQGFDEVFPKPLETWIEELRGANPESEVMWWESLLACYRAYTVPKDLTKKQKTAAFKILVMLGAGRDLQSLSVEFAALPEGAQAEISAMIGPKPN